MDSAAIGITGGGVELEGRENKEPTNWEEFSRDLRIANIRVCWPVGPDHLTVLVSFSTDRGHRKKSAADLFTFPPVTTTVYRNHLIWIHPHTLNVARVHTRLPRGDNWLTPAVPSES